MVPDPSADAAPDRNQTAIAASVTSSDAKGCSFGNSAHNILHYEQLLSIQQDQHALAMERKEAEISHLKVRLAAFEGQIAHQDALQAAVQSKDEECALMMAAKHKELELLATLLQMREQQIEELRSQCEDSQLQLTQMRIWSGSGSFRASPESTTPLQSHQGRPDMAQDSQTRREVQRLRLRMEDLEATVSEQQDRSMFLAKELQMKSERVEVLENKIRALKVQDASIFHQQGATEDAANEGRIGCVTLDGAAACQTHRFHGSQQDSSLENMGYQEPFARKMGPANGEPLASSPSPYPSEESCCLALHQDEPGLELPSTGRQSQELLREMRRLRQQMTELEKLAAGRDTGLTAEEKLATMTSLSMSSGSRKSGSNSYAQGITGSSFTEDRPGSGITQAVFRPHALDSCPASTFPMFSSSEDGILSAWEYRPHENDPVDSAVARLVNRGRYRAWRALLCRLEHGVYLCGTKRVHIRVDEERELLEASKDGGRSWADLSQILT